MTRRQEWQDEIRERIARAVERETTPPELDDFGFHYPTDYVEMAVFMLKQSSFCFWPQAGGLDDQDMYLIEDVMTWLLLERRARWEMEPADRQETLDGIKPEIFD